MFRIQIQTHSLNIQSKLLFFFSNYQTFHVLLSIPFISSELCTVASTNVCFIQSLQYYKTKVTGGVISKPAEMYSERRMKMVAEQANKFFSGIPTQTPIRFSVIGKGFGALIGQEFCNNKNTATEKVKILTGMRISLDAFCFNSLKLMRFYLLYSIFNYDSFGTNGY